MNIVITDTKTQYHNMLQLPESERADYFSREIMGPFAPMAQMTGMPGTAESMQALPLAGREAQLQKMLVQLDEADAWNTAWQAVEAAAQKLETAGIPLPSQVVVGILPGDPDALVLSRGYTGMGSIPGYILVVIAPNSYNLPRLPACVAHEFHHNALFHNAKWNFMTDVTVGKYLAVEGLAESFAASLYGEGSLGPWVTDISEADLETARRILAPNLGVKGFMSVSPYVFGDNPVMPQAQNIGMPYCGGYAAGYHAVQAYLKKTGHTVEDATLADGDAIMAQSGYFCGTGPLEMR